MVQYIVTPWRNRQQLLEVRRVFYPPPSDPISEKEKKNAVALVSVWVQRGNCPHLVESTALLVSTRLTDDKKNSAYAVRAAYAAAFGRFVTGLLDGYQDKKHKMSMYSIAKTIGLPASFVELRHQCTHEELPSRQKLRSATEKSLQWIWEHYWKGLGLSDLEKGEPSRGDGALKARSPRGIRFVLEEYLKRRVSGDEDVEPQLEKILEQVRIAGQAQVLEMLMELGGSGGAGYLLQSTRLAATIISIDIEAKDKKRPAEDGAAGNEKMSLEDVRLEMEAATAGLDIERPSPQIAEVVPDSESDDEEMASENEDDDGPRWETWKGPWISKPIGVV